MNYFREVLKVSKGHKVHLIAEPTFFGVKFSSQLTFAQFYGGCKFKNEYLGTRGIILLKGYYS